MPKNKGIYKLFRTKAEYDAHCEDLRHFSRVFMLDHVTIALGRMGWREKRFREFDKVLSDVMREYMDEYREDLSNDKEMAYSTACLDRELQQYVGGLFCPREERYG